VESEFELVNGEQDVESKQSDGQHKGSYRTKAVDNCVKELKAITSIVLSNVWPIPTFQRSSLSVADSSE
jgi:hypothetical protein